MDAARIVACLARAMEAEHLEGVLISNAAAALDGAPVTTIDLDFLIPRAPSNRKKRVRVPKALGATLYRQIFPASRVIRMMNDDETLQADFTDEVSDVRSFEGVGKRANSVTAGKTTVRVAALADMRAANRPRDVAALESWRRRLKQPRPTRKERLSQLRAQSEWLENDMIRRRVAAPVERRMNFLRKRFGICRSC